MFKIIPVLIALVLVSACSTTLPVDGQLQKTNETFSGTATGYLDGSGHLTIVSNKGATCTGNFVYVTSRKGEGIFTCDDGRSGPFEFVSAGRRGTGHGELANEKFVFTFGS